MAHCRCSREELSQSCRDQSWETQKLLLKFKNQPIPLRWGYNLGCFFFFFPWTSFPPCKFDAGDSCWDLGTILADSRVAVSLVELLLLGEGKTQRSHQPGGSNVEFSTCCTWHKKTPKTSRLEILPRGDFLYSLPPCIFHRDRLAFISKDVMFVSYVCCIWG